jgi:hypothetical protein
MYRKPLRDYPPATLHSLTAVITALLGYEELLPADLYVKLDLLRDDVARAATRPPRGTAALVSRPSLERNHP